MSSSKLHSAHLRVAVVVHKGLTDHTFIRGCTMPNGPAEGVQSLVMSVLMSPVAPWPLSAEEIAEFMRNMLTEFQIVILTALLIVDACAGVRSHITQITYKYMASSQQRSLQRQALVSYRFCQRGPLQITKTEKFLIVTYEVMIQTQKYLFFP